MKCQGQCSRMDECVGEVKTVMVYGGFCPNGMEFDYCQVAREEDERRGFRVVDKKEMSERAALLKHGIEP